MDELPWVHCPGCDAVFDPAWGTCPACGRCPLCGKRHFSAESGEECRDCKLPYCKCCGRCPKCHQTRPFDIVPCECGHPNDPRLMEELISRFAVDKAHRTASWGCVVMIVGLLTGTVMTGLIAISI